MATRPWLPAFYMKYLEMSKRYAFEAGGIRSDGQQLPSLAGYIPLPGTDIWFNPLSPISMRYVFPRQYDRYDDDIEQVGPVQEVVQYLYDWSTMFGLSLGPWITYPLYAAGLFRHEDQPKRSLFPQIELVPPNIQRMISHAAQRSIYPNAPDLWTPTVSWRDYMVELNMLADAIEQMSGAGMTYADKRVIAAR